MRAFALLATLALTGCATSPLASTQPLPPPSKIYDQALLTQRSNAGAIVITRDKGLFGAACTFDVSIDGNRVIGLRSGEQGTAYVDVGEHIVGAKGGCGNDRFAAQTAVTLKAGDSKRLRVGVRESGDVFIEPSAL